MPLTLLNPHNSQLGSDVLTNVTLNHEWRTHIHEALCRYFLPLIGFNFQDDDVYTTWQNFAALLMDLYTEEPCPMAIPVGAIVAFPFSAWSFDGWLACDGTHYTTAQYPALEAVIDDFFKDETGFVTPNIRERVIVDNAFAGIAPSIGYTDGFATHTLALSEVPAHSHNVVTPVTSGAGSNNGRVARGDGTTSGTFDSHTEASQGGGGAHNNLQPYIVLKYLIKAIEG